MMMHRPILFLLLLALVAAPPLLGGCSKSPPQALEPLSEPPDPDSTPKEDAVDKEAEPTEPVLTVEEQEELARIEEEERIQDAAEAEQARLREEQATRQQLREEAKQALAAFGVQGAPVQPPVKGPPQGLTFDEVEPALPEPPTVRVAILSKATQPNKAQQMALLIGRYQRDFLERNLGQAVQVVNVSHYSAGSASSNGPASGSLIYFRPEQLHAAMEVAAVLPDEQRIEPMSAEQIAREGVDLIVMLGQDYP